MGIDESFFFFFFCKVRNDRNQWRIFQKIREMLKGGIVAFGGKGKARGRRKKMEKKIYCTHRFFSPLLSNKFIDKSSISFFSMQPPPPLRSVILVLLISSITCGIRMEMK